MTEAPTPICSRASPAAARRPTWPAGRRRRSMAATSVTSTACCCARRPRSCRWPGSAPRTWRRRRSSVPSTAPTPSGPPISSPRIISAWAREPGWAASPPTSSPITCSSGARWLPAPTSSGSLAAVSTTTSLPAPPRARAWWPRPWRRSASASAMCCASRRSTTAPARSTSLPNAVSAELAGRWKTTNDNVRAIRVRAMKKLKVCSWAEGRRAGARRDVKRSPTRRRGGGRAVARALAIAASWRRPPSARCAPPEQGVEFEGELPRRCATAHRRGGRAPRSRAADVLPAASERVVDLDAVRRARTPPRSSTWSHLALRGRHRRSGGGGARPALHRSAPPVPEPAAARGRRRAPRPRRWNAPIAVAALRACGSAAAPAFLRDAKGGCAAPLRSHLRRLRDAGSRRCLRVVLANVAPTPALGGVALETLDLCGASPVRVVVRPGARRADRLAGGDRWDVWRRPPTWPAAGDRAAPARDQTASADGRTRWSRRHRALPRARCAAHHAKGEKLGSLAIARRIRTS